jgi:hypothetical protein
VDLHRLGTLRSLFIFRFACPAGSGHSAQTLGRMQKPLCLPAFESLGCLNPVRLTRALRAGALRRAISPDKFFGSPLLSPGPDFTAARTGHGSTHEAG